jgi:hypothetical protein
VVGRLSGTPAGILPRLSGFLFHPRNIDEF